MLSMEEKKEKKKYNNSKRLCELYWLKHKEASKPECHRILPQSSSQIRMFPWKTVKRPTLGMG